MAFKLGTLAATHRISKKMEEDTAFQRFVLDSLSRYCKGDWGELPDKDRQANAAAIANGYRILGEYASKELRLKIRIITEADRTYTTVLFPSKY